MCGLFGFIGVSKHPKITHRLMTALAVKTEVRGKEATGFWGAANGSEGGIIYHKEPVRSSEFVENPWWKRLESFNPGILLGHCREPSKEWKGHDPAPPKDNRNNHPHVSDDCTLAVVHNGKVDDYNFLVRGKYNGMTHGKCDSELVLKMFDIGKPYRNDNEFLANRVPGFEEQREVAPRLLGVSEIFSKLTHGAMAIGIGERLENGRRVLWLMRDEKRTLVVVDLQETLGIVVFASTKEIFKEAVEACPDVKPFVPLFRKVTEFPSFYAYRWEIDTEKPDQGVSLRKFQIQKTMITTDAEEDPEDIPIRKDEAGRAFYLAIPVSSGLDAEENIVKAEPDPNPLAATAGDTSSETVADTDDGDATDSSRGRQAVKITREEVAARQRDVLSTSDDHEDGGHSAYEEGDSSSEEEESCDYARFERVSDEIEAAIQSIKTNVHNMIIEGSLRSADLDEISEELEGISSQLVNSQYISEHGYR